MTLPTAPLSHSVDVATDVASAPRQDEQPPAMSPIGPLFWEALPDGRLLHDAPGWRAYTGQPAPLEETGWLASALHPDDRAATTSAWAAALRASQPLSVTHRLLGADGVYRRFLTQAAPILDTQGQVARWQGVSCDLGVAHNADPSTDQAGRIADWNPAAAELEAVFDAMADAVYVYDADSQLVRTNAAARALNPHAGERAYRAESFHDRIQVFAVRDASGEAISPEQTPAARIMRGERLVDVETLLRQPDGHDLHLSASGGPVRDPSGRTTGAVVVVRDVTARHLLERRTREALDVLLRIADIVTEPTTQTDARTLLARLAGALAQLTWVDSAHAMLVEETPTRLEPVVIYGVPDEEAEAWRQETLAFDASRDPRVPQIYALLRAGRVLAQRFSVDTPLLSPLTVERQRVHSAITAPVVVDDQLVGLLTIARVSAPDAEAPEDFAPWDQELLAGVGRLASEAIERGRLGAQLLAAEAARMAAEAATRQREEFLGIASHELHTPITNIKANAQITLRAIDHFRQTHELDAGLARAYALLQRSERNIARLNRIMEDMLDATRIQTEALQFHMEQGDLAVVMREVVEEQQLLWPERVIELEAPASLTLAQMDVERIGQAITNYLVNALKFSLTDAPVMARVSATADQARVEVSDRGPGIPASEYERIWERFYRSPDIAVRSGSRVGLGLGLYLCKTVVERHGGQVGLESVVGQGSTFWFILPGVVISSPLSPPS